MSIIEDYFGEGKIGTGVLIMNNIPQEAFTQLPAVRMALQALIVGTASMLLTNLSWYTVRNIGRGLALWGDRRRRIKTELLDAENRREIERLKALKSQI